MHHLVFDNQFTTHLPVDAVQENVRHEVKAAIFFRVQPTPVQKPELVAYSPECARLLGLSEADCNSFPFCSQLFQRAIDLTMHNTNGLITSGVILP